MNELRDCSGGNVAIVAALDDHPAPQDARRLLSNGDGCGASASLFHMHDGKLVVLHALIKKTRKTPAADLTLARKRMKDVTR